GALPPAHLDRKASRQLVQPIDPRLQVRQPHLSCHRLTSGTDGTPRGPGLTPTTCPDTLRRETLYDKVIKPDKATGPRPGLRVRAAEDIAALADLRGAVGVRGRTPGGPGGGLVGGGRPGPGVVPRAGGGGSAVLPRAGGHAARAGPAGRPGGDGRGVLPRPG